MNNYQFFIYINLKNMVIDFIIISNDETNPIFHKSTNLKILIIIIYLLTILMKL